jgi:hypothetical protein
MTNPLVHALAFVAAVLVPGGLLVYFAWHAARRRRTSLKDTPNQTPQKQGSEDISDELPTAEEALDAFLAAFPRYPKDSLRARSRARRLKILKTRPRKKNQ